MTPREAPPRGIDLRLRSVLTPAVTAALTATVTAAVTAVLKRFAAVFAAALALAAAGGTVPALAAGAVPTSPSTPSTPTAMVRTEQVSAELVAHAPEGVRPGQALWLGLRIVHARDWHTYWKNPGDSGLPTTLDWALPPGFAAGEIVWPTPKKLPVGPLMNFGYEGELLLPVSVNVPASYTADVLPVRLSAQWLVCKDVCIPESGEFALDVPVRAATVSHAAAFDAARQAAPQEAAGVKAMAEVRDGALAVRVSGLAAPWAGKPLVFFPETAGVIENAARPVAAWTGGEWTARVPLSAQRSESPSALPVVLVPEGQTQGVRVVLTVSGPWPAAGSAPPASEMAPGQASQAGTGGGPIGLLAAMALALVGGLILNLMPCVFPVLSLKVMGFAAHAHDRRALLAGGLAYTGGVVASFLVLAGALLALRAGGEQLGWGFQLQSPAFVAGLAVLFTLFGLNLAGLFEFGSVLPGSLAALRARHPMLDSALTGVLAVAVASPCTAPFMGASLGLAVTLPAHEALAVFAALGLGMALPYLAASAWPAVARALPRPGAWMAHFKTLMAFPMFATVIWLVWVLGQQSGIGAVAGLLGTLLAVAFATWVFGAVSLGPGARRVLGAVAVLLLAATVPWGWSSLHTGGATPSAGASAETDTRWQPWSRDRVAQALAQGRPVFVDFTAAWCVTCQFNKRNALADAQVLADFEAKRVVLLRADWTRRDPEITAELSRMQRSGVPVYALMTPGQPGPRLLSEILSVAELRDAIAALP